MTETRLLLRFKQLNASQLYPGLISEQDHGRHLTFLRRSVRAQRTVPYSESILLLIIS